MKLTKRMKNGIVQTAALSSLFLCILLGILFFSLYPKFSQFQDKKHELEQVSQKLQSTVEDGLSFADFKSSLWSINDSYSSNLLRNVNANFYEENFTNTGSADYSVFLDSLEQNILDIKASDEYIKKDNYISALLPTYDEYNSSPDNLSDFFFINYIENLLYSFNLSSTGEIGIWELENAKYDEIQLQKSNKTQVLENNLEEQIYRIPLSFNLVGQKGDIIDFIHYFENVSRISITQDGFEVYNDNFIQKTIEWSEPSLFYNIYENQLADIRSISLRDYPDSSSRETRGLIETLKWNQSREKYEVDIELWFYVGWVPTYKIQDFVTNFLKDYADISKQISSNAKKYKSQEHKYKSGNQIVAVNTLQSLDIVNIALWKEILALRKEFSKPENLESVYDKAVTFSEQFEKIRASYDLQLELLNK